jgi:hypothetical protein
VPASVSKTARVLLLEGHHRTGFTSSGSGAAAGAVTRAFWTLGLIFAAGRFEGPAGLDDRVLTDDSSAMRGRGGRRS